MAVNMDAEMKAFVELPLNADFGLTLDEVVSHSDDFGRFKAWLNGDHARIKAVLQNVQNAGMSPALFSAYESQEGYNPSWGWLNYTTPQGTPENDASFVANHMKDVSNDMGQQPAWVDGANSSWSPPADVIAMGNQHFSTLGAGTIGRAYIASTAAATWGTYYPQGLDGGVNGVQSYGNPLAGCIKVIKFWGGKITSSGGGGSTVKPSTPNKGQNTANKPATTKPAKNTAPTTPIFNNGMFQFQLGGNNHMMEVGSFGFNKNKKKSEKPTNTTNNKTDNNNHKEDVNQGNKDKPAPSKPNANLDLAWLDSIQGTFVGGSDQCYGLASAWAMHNGTPQLIGGSRQPGVEVAEPQIAVSMAAANIASEYPWASWGWEIIAHPTRDQIKAGDICCMVCDDPRGWIPSVGGVRYGHVCIAGSDSGGVFSLWEQNGTYRGGTAKQPATSGKPTLDTYMPYIIHAIRKK